MCSPRNAQIIALLVSVSFLFGPAFATAQTTAPKAQAPAKVAEPDKKNAITQTKLLLSNS